MYTELFRPLWTQRRNTEKIKPNPVAIQFFYKARFKPGPNVPCQSAQTDKSVSSAERTQLCQKSSMLDRVKCLGQIKEAKSSKGSVIPMLAHLLHDACQLKGGGVALTKPRLYGTQDRQTISVQVVIKDAFTYFRHPAKKGDREVVSRFVAGTFLENTLKLINFYNNKIGMTLLLFVMKGICPW